MNRLVEVRQTEFLGAESQVTFPANKRMLYYYSLFRWIVLLIGFACRIYRSMNTIIGSPFTQTGLDKIGFAEGELVTGNFLLTCLRVMN